MLRVGLTGGLGSGKTAVATLWLTEQGIPVIEADALGRALMQPGQLVYQAILHAFGPTILQPDGQLDRKALSREAFANHRLPELNRIVHPAVIAAQEQELARLAATNRHPLAVVESALIFEASNEASYEDSTPSEDTIGAPANHQPTAPGWRDRFDKLVLVTAPEPLRLERFVQRVAGPNPTEAHTAALREEARRRLAHQLPDAQKRPHVDYIIENNQTLVLLRRRALAVLTQLRKDADQS